MSIEVRISLLVMVGLALMPLSVFGESAGEQVLSGQVVGPAGESVAGAKVYVSSYTQKNHAEPMVRATTGTDGRFRFTATAAEIGSGATVTTVAPGFGPDWLELSQVEASGELPPLRLVKECEPIEGRVLDLENGPIAGATVRVVRVRKMPGEDLQQWIKDMRAEANNSTVDTGKGRGMIYYERLLKSVWGVLGVPQAVQTDAEGHFQLSGFGCDRIVELKIEAPDIEHRQLTVLSRRDVPAGLPPFMFGSRFVYRAALAKPIAGTVLEKSSGKLVPGVEVSCAWNTSGGLNDLMLSGIVSASTDAQGRYRLVGVPKSNLYYLSVAGAPYFTSIPKTVTDTAGLEPITVDVELERGVLMRGQVNDKVTGRPVDGKVYYLPRVDNPHLKEYPEFAMISTSSATVEPDGSFAMAVIPGRGLLCVRAEEDRFMRAAIDGPSRETPELLKVATFHAIEEVDVSETVPRSLQCSFALDPGRTLLGRVYGPDGQPLNGAFAAGLTDAPSTIGGSSSKPKLALADWTAVALKPESPRTLVFWDEERKLGKALLLRGDERGTVNVRLEPLGSVEGVLVDADGRALADAKLQMRYSARQEKTLPGELRGGVPGMTLAPAALGLPEATTAQNGSFRVEGLIGGIEYDIFVQQGKSSSMLAEAISVTDGECKRLGRVHSDQKTK